MTITSALLINSPSNCKLSRVDIPKLLEQNTYHMYGSTCNFLLKAKSNIKFCVIQTTPDINERLSHDTELYNVAAIIRNL